MKEKPKYDICKYCGHVIYKTKRYGLRCCCDKKELKESKTN